MIKLINLFLLSFFTVSCLTPANVKEMTVYDFDDKKNATNCIYVNKVGGGKDTIPYGWGRPTIQNDNFKEAIKLSLERINLLCLKEDDWTLEVRIIEASDRNIFIFDAKVFTDILYIIKFKQNKKIELNISEEGIVKFSDIFFAEMRIKKAMEISARNNIREFMKIISRLNFRPDGSVINTNNEKIPDLY